MKLIVGLGNPGRSYANTRHNIGSLVIKELAEARGGVFKNDSRVSSLTARLDLAGEAVVLAAPATFMNLSGAAVNLLLKKYSIDDLASLLVVCDDLDLSWGRLKIKPSGSSAGHRGIKSIIEHLNTDKFARLRVGIGRPQQKGHEISDYVLSHFTRQEKKALEEVLQRASLCCQAWIAQGITKCMDMFNQKR